MASTTAAGKGSAAGAAAIVPANIAIAATKSVDGFILDLEVNEFSICLIKRADVCSLEHCSAYRWLGVVFVFEFERVGLELRMRLRMILMR
jgi:hypothetical protein